MSEASKRAARQMHRDGIRRLHHRMVGVCKFPTCHVASRYHVENEGAFCFKHASVFIGRK